MGLSTFKIEIRRQILDHLLIVVGEENGFICLKEFSLLEKYLSRHISFNHLKNIVGHRDVSTLVSTLAGFRK